jgi:hypothetical protein
MPQGAEIGASQESDTPLYKTTTQPLNTTDAMSLLRDSFIVFHSKSVPKWVRDRIEGCHRVRGASAVKMGTVTFTVTFIVTSRHFRDFCDLALSTSYRKEAEDNSNR